MRQHWGPVWPRDDLNERWDGQKLVHVILPSFCLREAPGKERRAWRAESTDIYFVQGTAYRRQSQWIKGSPNPGGPVPRSAALHRWHYRVVSCLSFSGHLSVCLVGIKGKAPRGFPCPGEVWKCCCVFLQVSGDILQHSVGKWRSLVAPWQSWGCLNQSALLLKPSWRFCIFKNSKW